jgi:hypothetical protein
MKTLLTLITAAFLSTGAIAADVKAKDAAKTEVKKEKRTKKTEICQGCGKPESKCDCDDEKSGEKHEHKDGEAH